MRVCVFCCFFNVLIGVYGVLIIPKWLIKVPGHIPILFGWILELPTFSLFTGPDSPYLSCKYLKRYKKNQDHFRNILSFHISTFWNSNCLTFLDLSPPIFLCIIFQEFPPNKIFLPSCLEEFFMEQFWTAHYFDKMQNHKQIRMKSEIFSRSVDHLCLNQECGGILIFLANPPLKFAWIIGIYGKPIF